MKHLIACLFLLITTTISSQSIYPTGIGGCVARWTFDTTEVSMLTSVPDKSNNNNHGTPYLVQSVNGFRGKPFAAGGFNGNSSWVNVNHNSNLNSKELTILSLVKLSGFNNDLCQGSQIISKGYPYFIPGNYGQVITDNPYDGDCNVYTPNNSQLCTQVGTNSINYSAGNYLEPNKWYFLASVIKEDSIAQYQVYMDTLNKLTFFNPIYTAPLFMSLDSNTMNISIGKHLNPQYSYWLNGSIDELIIFNQALAYSDIYDVYSYLWGYPNALNSIETNDFDINYWSGRVTIKTDLKNYEVIIYSVDGKVVFKSGVLHQNSNFDLSSKPNGIYLLRIEQNNTCITKKILKN